MALLTSILTGGVNNHETTSEEVNAFYTDFLSEGVVGAIANTGGVAPATGGFAVNAQGTPAMFVDVSAGVAYVTGTPTSQNSQTFRVKNTATASVTISANSSGSTKYDWIYIKLDATNLNAPNTAGDNVATLVASRSSSSASDDGTPPTYGYPIAVVTVANGASSITNGNIQDIRSQTTVDQGINTSDGWASAGETWTYASATTFTVAGTDVRNKYPIGTKIKLTQTTVKYFRVVNTAFSTNTTITITGVGDYTLANATITNPYYSYDQTPEAYPRKLGDWFEEIGRATLTGAGDTITINPITTRKYLRIYVAVWGTGGTVNPELVLNNDTADASYNRRVSDSFAAGSAGAGVAINLTDAASAETAFVTVDILNITARNKLIISQGIVDAGDGAAPTTRELFAQFEDSTNAITRVDVINNGGTGDFAIGSEVVVLGHD